MTIVCPTLPNAAAEVLKKWMDKTWAGVSGEGEVDVIRRLTVMTSTNAKKSPTAEKWNKSNPWPGRLELLNIQQNDTAILLPDLVIYGGINLAHSGHFTALASTDKKVVSRLMEVYKQLAEHKQSPTKKVVQNTEITE